MPSTRREPSPCSTTAQQRRGSKLIGVPARTCSGVPGTTAGSNCTGLRVEFSDDVLVVGVPNTYAREWLEQRLSAVIKKTLSEVGKPEVAVRFQVISDLADSNGHRRRGRTSAGGSPLFDEPRAQFNPRYSFEGYIVGGSNRFAHALHKLGVNKGDRVAIVLPNIPQFVIGVYGTLKAGGVVVSTMPLLRTGELRPVIDASLPSAQRSTPPYPPSYLPVGVVDRRKWCEGRAPDPQMATAGRYDASPVELVGQAVEIGEQQVDLFVGSKWIRRPQQHQGRTHPIGSAPAAR